MGSAPKPVTGYTTSGNINGTQFSGPMPWEGATSQPPRPNSQFLQQLMPTGGVTPMPSSGMMGNWGNGAPPPPLGDDSGLISRPKPMPPAGGGFCGVPMNYGGVGGGGGAGGACPTCGK